jgi:arylsulfatase A-like enzyme
MKSFIVAFALILTLSLASCFKGQQNPNIIIVYTDDLGYGDVSAYGATEINTPNMDFLANNGVQFTQGYASSATCTPSRYALLTGTYPWKEKRARILPGTAPLIIDTAQITLPKMLKKQGYETAVIGKWHLGLGTGQVDWNSHISPGPNEIGFDHAYIMAATQDRVPTVYIENGYVDGLDPSDPIEISYKRNYEGQATGKNNPELLSMMWHHGHNGTIVNGVPRIGFMKGGESAKWSDIDMADHFLNKVKKYIKSKKDKPFFLYYGMQQPHVPRTPHPRFVGATSLGPRGDVIAEADWCVGELLKTLEQEGLLENTLIVFSSDNGPVLNDGYYDDAVEKNGNHTAAGVLRGGKYSLFEAGTRVPFMVYWKGKIQPKKSDALVSQLDLFSSFARLTGSNLRADDSVDLLDTFIGKSDLGRKELILEATTRTALRSGDWVMIPPYIGPAKLKAVNIEIGNSNNYQLYDLSQDISQQVNLAESKPEKLNEMILRFKEIRGNSYSKVKKIELK